MSSPDIKSLEILLVDDSKDLVSIWMILFDSFTNWKVKTANSGAKAIELLQSGYRPDIVITDFYLGDLTGLDIVTFINDKKILSKVIVVTGNEDNEELKRMSEKKVIELLIKPVKFNTLTATVEKLELNYMGVQKSDSQPQFFET